MSFKGWLKSVDTLLLDMEELRNNTGWLDHLKYLRAQRVHGETKRERDYSNRIDRLLRQLQYRTD